MHVKLWLESPKGHLGSEGINGMVKYQRGIREIAFEGLNCCFRTAQ